MAIDTITSFESLGVWQKSQDLAVDVYKLTRGFPKDETFAMTSQLRRASSSVSANIAEGFGRSAMNDKLHFYTMAYGSLLEVKNFAYLANRIGYITSEDLTALLEQITICQKMLNAFKSGLKRSA